MHHYEKAVRLASSLKNVGEVACYGKRPMGVMQFSYSKKYVSFIYELDLITLLLAQ